MIHLSTQGDIDGFKKAQKERILAQFNHEEDRSAKLITKAEFEESHPADKFEIYSLAAIDKFRQEISKADGIEDADAAFKSAVAELRPWLVVDNGKRHVVFTKKK